MNLLTQETCPISDYCTVPNCSHTKLERRFWAKVQIGKLDECWEWKGYVSKSGYGHFKRKKTKVYAHRLAYELLVGTIPPGLVIDHLCRNRRCINPFHLEVVTQKENIHRGETNVRKTHCPNGHPLSGDNLYVAPKNGSRHCRICRSMQDRKCKETHNRFRRQVSLS